MLSLRSTCKKGFHLSSSPNFLSPFTKKVSLNPAPFLITSIGCLKKSNFSSFVEEKTFQFQSSLLRLPIPTLEETMHLYLKSLKPLLSSKDYQHSESLVKDFIQPGGMGEKLQAQLIEYDQKQPNSWLEEFWLKYAYLIWRCPTMINVNWWCHFIDTLTLPKSYQAPYNEIQLIRAAYFISYMVQAYEKIQTQTWPVDKTKQGPLCMHQYSMVFGTTRIPELGMDRLIYSNPTSSKHIILMIQDHCYKMDIPTTDLSHVFQQLQSIVRSFQLHHSSSKTTTKNTNVHHEIGVLTSENRDTWAHLRQHMLQSKENQRSLECIEKALFVVSLDDHAEPHGSALAHQWFHHYGRNRWFDKSINLIVLPDGQVGVNGEHAPCDAVVPGDIFNWVNHQVQTHCSFSSFPTTTTSMNSTSSNPELIQPLTWHIDSTLNEGIQLAKQHALELGESIDVCLYHGPPSVEWMKKYTGSPDAFIQMMLQRAFYLDQKEWTATYESASTRKFKHGRTECVRSCSEQAQKWVYAMDDPNVSSSEQLALFHQAIQTHVQYLKRASMGKGCDRHLLGLKLMFSSTTTTSSSSSPIHPFFTDPAYSLSSKFRLSTSNMSPGTYLYGGFGPVTDDGYGVNYAMNSNQLKFSVSSWKTCSKTHATRFRQRLVSVIEETKAFLEKHS